MKGAAPNVRKAKAIHEKKQAERNATANKMKKRAATTRRGKLPHDRRPLRGRRWPGYGPIPNTARAYPRR